MATYGLRWSLRDLLFAVAFVGVACVTLRFAGNIAWSILSGISLLLFLAVAVVAFVDREARRAWAIGFSVCTAGYGALLFAFGQAELEPDTGHLPTSKLLSHAFAAMADVTWYDFGTGIEMPNYRPPSQDISSTVFVPASNTAIPRWSLSRTLYMHTGHLLWALFFGFLGGHFARYIYLHNQQRWIAPEP